MIMPRNVSDYTANFNYGSTSSLIGGVVVFAVNSLLYLNQSVPPFGVSLNSLTTGTTAFPLREYLHLHYATHVSTLHWYQMYILWTSGLHMSPSAIITCNTANSPLITFYNSDKSFKWSSFVSTCYHSLELEERLDWSIVNRLANLGFSSQLFLFHRR